MRRGDDRSPPSRLPMLEAELQPRPLDVGALRRVLARRWWLVALFALGGLLASGYLVWRSEPLYRAAGTIRLLDTRQELAGQLASDASSRRRSASAAADPLQSQVQLLLSRSVAERVVERPEGAALRVRVDGIPRTLVSDVVLDPALYRDSVALHFSRTSVHARQGDRSVETVYGAPIDLAGARFTITAPPRDVRRATLHVLPAFVAASQLSRGLTARVRDETDLIDLTMTSTDPVLAQQQLNRLIESFQLYNVETTQHLMRQRREFIEGRLQQSESLLVLARDSLSRFRSATVGAAPSVADASQVVQLHEQRLALEAERARFARLRSRLEAAVAAGVLGDDHPAEAMAAVSGGSSPVVAELHGRLRALQASRDSLVSGPWATAPTHPDVVRLDNLIRRSQRLLLDAADGHVRMLDDRLAATRDVLARTSTNQQALPRQQAEEARLAEQQATYLHQTEQLRAELQRAQIAEAAQATEVIVVDTAYVSSAPIGTSAPRRLAVGLLLGVVLGMGLIYLLERLNTTIRSQEDIEHLLRVPGLASIPPAPRAGRRRFGRSASAPIPASAAALPAVMDKHHSPVADAYRILRTNLLFARGTDAFRMIVVTSPASGDGKSTISANLAASFAQQGLRVLLVDGDLRRAMQHRLFGLQRVPGLTDLVRGEASAERAIRGASDRALPLSVLPAGTLPANSTELLGSEAVRDTLLELRGAYELVIVDTAPVLATAEAAILGALADGVLLVLRAGRTERAEGEMALRQLATVGARVLGTVLNDPDSAADRGTGYPTYYPRDEYAATI